MSGKGSNRIVTRKDNFLDLTAHFVLGGVFTLDGTISNLV